MTTRGGLLGVLLVLLLVSCPLTVAAAEKERQIALVIGISAYQHAPVLTNPVNDARGIGDALRRLKFDVTEIYDGDYRTLSSAIRAFGIRAASAEVAVVYYAGHGVQVDRENYLIPSDARLERERDLLYEAIPVERLLGEVSQAGKIGIVLLDSCRNNPFAEHIARALTTAGRAMAITPGMARVDNVPRNTMVVMAAKADQIAEDGQDHSPFAAAILAHLQIPGLELGLFFRSVRDTVLRATANRQEPYVFSSLGAEPFYFYPRPPNRPPEIGPIRPLELSDLAGPTPLGVPQPTDPDQDPLTIRVIGLPHGGEVRIDGRVAALNMIVAADRFKAATFKPDGKIIGSAGTLDLLIEDGRGGSITASLPITIRSSHHPPIIASPAHLRIVRQALGIPVPVSPDHDPLTVTVRSLPRGVVMHGGAVLHAGDHLTPDELTNLSYMPDAGFLGAAGTLRYRVDNGRGDLADGTVDIEIAEPEAAKPGIAVASVAGTQPKTSRGTVKPTAREERLALLKRVIAAMPPATAERDSVARNYADKPGSKALAISPEAHGSFQSGEWPTTALAEQNALEGCQVMYGTPCLLLAHDDQMLAPTGAGEWPRHDMPRVRYGGLFDPGQIPVLRDATRSGPQVTGYAAARQPKAMAIHSRGLVFAVSGASSQTAAEEQALAACNDDPERKGQDGPCYLYATANQVVLPWRLIKPDPYSRIAAAAMLVRPFASDPAYARAREKKALAIHVESGRTFRWDNLDTQDRANQLALEGCQQQYGDPCVLLAAGEELVASDPRVAPRRDMERLHYRGTFTLDEVPFLRNSPDLRAYAELPGFKAIAVRPLGAISVVISGAASVADAERQALAGCNARQTGSSCFVYASGNQVVLPDRRTEARR